MSSLIEVMASCGVLASAVMVIIGIWIGALWLISRDQRVQDDVRRAVALDEQSERDAREADVAGLVRARLERYDAAARADRERREEEAWTGLERLIAQEEEPRRAAVLLAGERGSARRRITRAQAQWRARRV